MAEKTKAKNGKALKRRTKRVAVPKKGVSSEGLNMDDLVGSITISVDPLEFQRRIRDEW